MLMFFTMIIIYDINNKNKQRFFNEDIKNIINIHNLMSESIYGNSFNNPKINHLVEYIELSDIFDLSPEFLLSHYS